MLEKSQLPKLSLQEAAASYDHIELTEDEKLEAIIWRKQKKEDELRKKEIAEREAKNRTALTGKNWSFDQTKNYMGYRSSKLFETKFLLDASNEMIFDLLCAYFSEDGGRFLVLAGELELEKPSLNKGILLTGNVGNGKTTLMKLFSKNQRQVFYIRSAKQIADDFQAGGDEVIQEYKYKVINPADDVNSFYHKFSGLCIDDIGTEDIKNHYGNKKNVVGDLIEDRYAQQNTGVFLHGTTNLSADQIGNFYGARVKSRMREIFNFIELTGNDRRK